MRTLYRVRAVCELRAQELSFKAVTPTKRKSEDPLIASKTKTIPSSANKITPSGGLFTRKTKLFSAKNQT